MRNRSRSLTLIAAAAALAGCTAGSSAAERAEQRYHFLADNGGTMEEQCAAARAAQSAWADAGNSDKYRSWKLTADIGCRRAEQMRTL